jgi:hypothetical protein
MVATLTGAAPDIEDARHLNLVGGQRADGSVFYGPDREPSLDLDVPVDHIGGLDNFVLPIRNFSGGSGTNGWSVSG